MANKFHAKKINSEDGIFDSKKEYNYFLSLKLQMKAIHPEDRVEKIERQVRYDIDVNGKRICFYKLDFRTTYGDGTVRCVDVKGLKIGSAYQNFRLKKKLVEAIYGIEIIEV